MTDLEKRRPRPPQQVQPGGRIIPFKGFLKWSVAPNNHGFSLLEMMILGCFWGSTIFGSSHFENDDFQSRNSPFPEADFQVNHVKLQGCKYG